MSDRDRLDKYDRDEDGSNPWVPVLWMAAIIAGGMALSFYLAGLIHTMNYGPV